MVNTTRPSRISQKLRTAGPFAFSAWCIVAAFTTYSCMYAFRKPFTAGTFEGTMLLGVGYKTILVASQVAGYTLSKFLGIRIVSEMPASRRVVGILLLIGIAELALLMFALTPAPWNFLWLFINGLPLGIVFGLVLAFLEGRQLTEALAAGLCASFIWASGVVKSVGRTLVIDYDVSEYWMPFWTGLLFVVPLFLGVWMLSQIPGPSQEDIARRSARPPMTRDERRTFLTRHALGLSGLLSIFVLITVMRSIRDDFAVEIWADLGEEEQPAIFAISETWVTVVVTLISGAAIFIRNNRTAFLTSLGLVAGGFGVVLVTLAGHGSGWFGSFPFMVLLGLGTYVPYVVFHTTIFERLIATCRETGNLGYLMYLADSLGYLGYILVMVLRNLISTDINFLQLMRVSSAVIASVSLVILILVTVHYVRRLPRTTAA
ncbi:MAG: DUF5690 family protein [Planctomycetaceae bacterium]